MPDRRNTNLRVHPTLTLDEIKAIVEEAQKAGRRVAAHAMTREGIRNSVEGGVDSIEHGNDVDTETLALMSGKGTFLVPTVSAAVGR